MNITDLKNIVSDTAFSWLTSKASLTRRLREFTDNQIKHHLFYDDWGNAEEPAITALNLLPHSKTWIRKMQWRLGDQIWVVCDVIIPESSITPKTAVLKQIGKNSIGDILFQDPNLRRSDFSYFMSDNHISRYSIFYFYEQPILIIENFLPAFFQAIEAHE